MSKISVSVNLIMDEEDLQYLVNKAGCADISVSTLLSEFVGDLVEDERSFASAWYDARYRSCMDEISFLHWIIANEFDVSDVVASYDRMVASRDRLLEYTNSNVFNDSDELSELKEDYDSYRDDFYFYYDGYYDFSLNAVISVEIEKCRVWLKEVEELEKTVVKHEEKK